MKIQELIKDFFDSHKAISKSEILAYVGLDASRLTPSKIMAVNKETAYKIAGKLLPYAFRFVPNQTHAEYEEATGTLFLHTRVSSEVIENKGTRGSSFAYIHTENRRIYDYIELPEVWEQVEMPIPATVTAEVIAVQVDVYKLLIRSPFGNVVGTAKSATPRALGEVCQVIRLENKENTIENLYKFFDDEYEV